MPARSAVPVPSDPDETFRGEVAMLGYRRDLSATELRRTNRRSESIGLVFYDVSNPFHAAAKLVQRGSGELRP